MRCSFLIYEDDGKQKNPYAAQWQILTAKKEINLSETIIILIYNSLCVMYGWEFLHLYVYILGKYLQKGSSPINK